MIRKTGKSSINALAKLAAVGVLLAAAPCWATVVVSTFGPGDSYNTSGSWGIGDSTNQQEVAFSFSPSFQGTLDSIRVGVINFGRVNNYNVYLASDNSGAPGAALETFGGLGFPSFSSGIITLSSLIRPVLLSGSTYWVVMSAPDLSSVDGGWNLNGQGFNGFSERYVGSAGWVKEQGSFPNGFPTYSPAVEVNATATAPEPATLGLTLGAILAMVALRRRGQRT